MLVPGLGGGGGGAGCTRVYGKHRAALPVPTDPVLPIDEPPSLGKTSETNTKAYEYKQNIIVKHFEDKCNYRHESLVPLTYLFV